MNSNEVTDEKLRSDKISALDRVIKPVPVSNYCIDLELKYLKGQLDRYKSEYGLELNPDFQRGHVWTQEQKINYVEALLRGSVGFSGQIISFNCPDFRGHDKAKDSDLDQMLCIDGLQRLSAITEYMQGEFKIFAELNGGVDYQFFDGTRYSFKSNFVKIQVFNMQYKRDVLEYHLAFNDGVTPHSQEEIRRVKGILSECKR